MTGKSGATKNEMTDEARGWCVLHRQHVCCAALLPFSHEVVNPLLPPMRPYHIGDVADAILSRQESDA